VTVFKSILLSVCIVETAIFPYIVCDVLAEAPTVPPTEYMLDKTYVGKECKYTVMNISYNV
jgi:hypothetical protein